MAKPTIAEKNKKAKDLEVHLKKLADSETGQQKIPSLMTMVRGAIRSSWAKSPAKLAYWEMGREPDNDPTTARKWKMKCEMCGRYYNCDTVEIDHKEGNHKFTTPADFETYFDNILDIQFKDLQRICKYRCHRVKSHFESQNHPDMPTAACDKVNIFFTKFISTDNYTKWLVDNNVVPESTAAKRKKQGLQFLLDQRFEEEYIMDFFEACDYIMRLEDKKKKAKRFSLKTKDYDYIKQFESFWSTTGVQRPTFNFTVI